MLSITEPITEPKRQQVVKALTCNGPHCPVKQLMDNYLVKFDGVFYQCIWQVPG